MPRTRILHFGGSFLALAGVSFVAMRLADYSEQLDISRFGLRIWFMIGFLALIYCAANILLVLAWRNLLQHFGAGVAPRWAIRTYGVSQIAKYVPGNILHLAGRQVLGMAAGVSGLALAKASIWELSLLACVGALFGLLVLPQLVPVIPTITTYFMLFLALLFVIVVAKRYMGGWIAQAIIWQTSFLTVSGLIFLGLLILVTGSVTEISSAWPIFMGSYVLAWFAGLVTPGAPAGVGVRELVLLLLLHGLVGEADLIMTVVLGRVVTAVGDILFFVLSLALVKSSTCSA